MILFYTFEINDNKASLEEDEFAHCCKVLRHKEGDIIHITNGAGIFAEAQIEKVHKRSAELSVISQESHPPKNFKIELAVAPPKTRTRWEWLLEKCVEVGVDVISPILTSNTERKKINLERNKKIIRSAALQSKRLFHPRMNELSNLKTYLTQPEVESAGKILCHYALENPHLSNLEIGNSHVIIFIGPEGDFSSDELSNLNQLNCTQVNISSNRLRTETASVIGVSQLDGLMQQLKLP